ncbi:hypothetical protein [Paenibacillus sp. 2TAB19]|uniref:hypothetical protein n=1 Tax=Paenibacillus sp. 2TAB19 TaxID=3233003 RepID=UPI003F9EA544
MKKITANGDDGTPDAGKLARPVWRRGKAGDYFKRLPIATYSSTGRYGSRLHNWLPLFFEVTGRKVADKMET